MLPRANMDHTVLNILEDIYQSDSDKEVVLEKQIELDEVKA